MLVGSHPDMSQNPSPTRTRTPTTGSSDTPNCRANRLKFPTAIARPTNTHSEVLSHTRAVVLFLVPAREGHSGRKFPHTAGCGRRKVAQIPARTSGERWSGLSVALNLIRTPANVLKKLIDRVSSQSPSPCRL